MFAMYGVGLWFGAWLISKSNEANPNCVLTGFQAAGCFSGGDVSLVRCLGSHFVL